MNSFVAVVALAELSKHDPEAVQLILMEVEDKYGKEVMPLIAE